MPRDIDYNLLKALHALLEERSVTRAAERLGVTQPAVSASLARLRRHYNDELLVRVGNRHRLTPLALQLAERVTSAIALTDRAFSLQPDFSPATSRREFTLALSDYAIKVVGGPLSRLLAEEAPHVRIHLRHVTAEAVDAAPESLRGIDAFVLPHGFLTDVPHKELLCDEWVCLLDAHNSTVGAELTARHLGELPWILVFHRPTAFTTAARELRMHGIEPDVRLVTEHYDVLPTLIEGTDRITLIQRRLAEKATASGRLRWMPAPVPLAPLRLALWWHPANTADAGHQWLRDLLTEAARTATGTGVPGGRHGQGHAPTAGT
ncbi:LysR family transcriptional regulator [Streptomyces sp. SID4956]|nr:LysR family transcriptional regulator [Streptomyces sp. SID4956]